MAALIPRACYHPDDQAVVKALHFRQPVIGQRSGRDHDALLNAVFFLGGGQGGDDLQRLAKTHLVRQNAAHSGLIQGQKPVAAPALIGRQLLLQLLGHIVLLRRLTQRLNSFFGFRVRLRIRPGHAQHADHISGPIGAEAELPRILGRVGLVQTGRIQQLLHHRCKAHHIPHIQKFAGFQPYILLPLSDGVQNGQ